MRNIQDPPPTLTKKANVKLKITYIILITMLAMVTGPILMNIAYPQKSIFLPIKNINVASSLTEKIQIKGFYLSILSKRNDSSSSLQIQSKISHDAVRSMADLWYKFMSLEQSKYSEQEMLSPNQMLQGSVLKMLRGYQELLARSDEENYEVIYAKMLNRVAFMLDFDKDFGTGSSKPLDYKQSKFWDKAVDELDNLDLRQRFKILEGRSNPGEIIANLIYNENVNDSLLNTSSLDLNTDQKRTYAKEMAMLQYFMLSNANLDNKDMLFINLLSNMIKNASGSYPLEENDDSQVNLTSQGYLIDWIFSQDRKLDHQIGLHDMLDRECLNFIR